MLLPMDTDFQNEPVPDVLKNRYVYLWYMEATLLILLAVGEIIGGDGFAALFMMILAFAIMHMVRDNCRQMSMYCLFIFGLLVGFQGFFEAVALFTVVSEGRSTETQDIKSGNETSITYETNITVHPFFDSSQNVEYNVSSAMMIASPTAMILCCILCYISYNAYTNPLFGEDDVESAPLRSRGFNSGPPRGYGGNYGAEAPRPRNTGSCPPRLFEGQGQRLGG
mmetsp:Transcript_87309/g.154748  ORF Transcript_87309/g.154748 Transcript_87309/m.154748 type:complete len:224 (+) Transcript_87309:84-755(+)